MMPVTDFYLIRHAESQPDASIPESQWPLSALGKRQAEELCDQLADSGIDRIVSSPFKRAVDTVTPLSEKLGLSIETDSHLRERTLSQGMIENWLTELERTWLDFDYSLPGGESSRSCQERITVCMYRLARESNTRTVAVSSHGNAIALFMNSLQPDFGFQQWQEMKNPDLFRLTWDGESIQWNR